MISYKINVTEALKEAGFNASTAKQTGIFSQSTMRKFREGDTGITLDNLNRLCCILEMQRAILSSSRRQTRTEIIF